MKKITIKKLSKVLILSLAIVFLVTCKKDNSNNFDSLDILSKLNSLTGVSATEITPPTGYLRAFKIDITQPLDHNNPNGSKFTQRAYLSFADETSPMVFAPNGYGANPSGVQEIAGVLQANCLNVAHRYFPDSKPSPLDWTYLTIEQSAADHHNIVTLFKKIFKGKWISSGASKSGLCALFHRKYYPNDVDATIAYVAPFTFGVKDERYPEYLGNIGGGDCFSKLKMIQLYVLKHRSEFLGMINSYIQSSSDTYSMDRDKILELNIMDYPFTFWQYFNYTCSSIPDTTTCTASQVFTHYTSIVPISSFSDNNINYYEPYSYQAITELGAPAYETGYIRDYLKKVDPDAIGNPNYEMVAPQGITYTFKGNTIADIYSWLQNHGDKIIYIYGKNDPWSAGAIELTGAADALMLMQNGANHRVKIANLDNPNLVYDKLESWLGIQINASKSSLLSADKKDEVGFRLKE